MRIVNICGTALVFGLSILGCNTTGNQVAAPTPAAPTPAASAAPAQELVWGYVVSAESGECIAGALVQVVDSTDPSIVGMQNRQDTCDFDDGIGYAFHFALVSGTQMTLRASQDGYVSQTVTTTAFAGPAGGTHFHLARVQ
jgi:hypothetical protein